MLHCGALVYLLTASQKNTILGDFAEDEISFIVCVGLLAGTSESKISQVRAAALDALAEFLQVRCFFRVHVLHTI